MPHPGRDVARVVPVHQAVVERQRLQPLVLERLRDDLVQRAPGVQQRPGGLVDVVGGVGVLEVDTSQQVPRLGERVDVVDPLPPGAASERAPRPPPAGRPGCPTASRARLLSSKRCSRIGSTGTRSSSRSRGRPDLRNRSRMTAGNAVDVGPASQRKPSCSTKPTAPPSRSRRSTTVTSWPSFASRAAAAVPPNPPPTTTTRAMRRSLDDCHERLSPRGAPRARC